MSVDNMPVYGGAFVPSESARESAPQTIQQSALTFTDFRRQVVTIELMVLALSGATAALIVSQSASDTAALIFAAAFTALWVTAVVARGAFSLANVDSVEGLKRLAQGTAIAFGLTAGLGLLLGAIPFRDLVLWQLLLGVPLVVAARYASIRRLRTLRGVGEARVTMMLVTPSRERARLTREVLDDGRFELADTIDPSTVSSDRVVAHIAEQAIAGGVDAVLLSSEALSGPEELRHLAWALEEKRINILVSSPVKSYAKGRVSIQRVADEMVLDIDHSHKAGSAHLVKRALDVVASTALLVVFVPVIFCFAVAVKIESRGPAFFVQPRVGKNGELFPFYKLRSMRPNAHLEREDVLGETDEGILERYRNDRRITRVGSFIRRWSIDELPQLLNVFLGHMSLVGPRPVLEAELHDLPVNGERVHLAKPGLTGMWQISGRKEIHWEDRIDLDLEYVDSWSLGLDAKIAAKTAGAVLKGSGAY